MIHPYMHRILAVLREANGPISIEELAAKAGMTPKVVVTGVSALRKEGIRVGTSTYYKLLKDQDYPR